jgi:hypothetical protein
MSDLGDAAWANHRLRSLKAERDELEFSQVTLSEVPVLRVDEAMAYRRRSGTILAGGDVADRRKLVRACVARIRPAPEDLTVETRYKLPEPVVNGVVARACYAAIHDAFSAHLVRRWRLPTKGRRRPRQVCAAGTPP